MRLWHTSIRTWTAWIGVVMYMHGTEVHSRGPTDKANVQECAMLYRFESADRWPCIALHARFQPGQQAMVWGSYNHGIALMVCRKSVARLKIMKACTLATKH